MTPEGQQRKEFEEWAKTQPRIREGLRLIRDSEGNYMSDDAEIAWEAWQAAIQKEIDEYCPLSDPTHPHGIRFREESPDVKEH
jgi:hypothetical protein